MKNIMVTILLLFVWTCNQANGDIVKRIEVTTTNDITQELNDVSLTYSDKKMNSKDGYFQIYPQDHERTCLWVDLSNVELASFRKEGDEQICTMKIENGKEITGRFHDPALKITGNNELGKVTLDLSRIGIMKFTGFESYADGKFIVIDRQQFREKRQKSKNQSNGGWTIDDGGEVKYTGKALYIWDSYSTDFDGWDKFFGVQRIDGAVLRYATLSDSVLVEFGVGNTSVKFEDIDSFTTSGKILADCPEALITKGGKTFTTKLLVRTSRLRGQKKDVYGTFDEDDYLVWETPLGYQGLALAPLRNVRAQRTMKDIAKNPEQQPEPDK